MRQADLPLAGIRVLELGHDLAAPFTTRLLGDLGAEIIKVEPRGGDPIRQWGARYKGSAPWWSGHARNKRRISLDLKKPEARAIVLDLGRQCDALVENVRPGQLAPMGLSETELRAARPDLVIARISGPGQDGPGRNRAAFGVIGEAVGGLRHLTNQPPPAPPTSRQYGSASASAAPSPASTACCKTEHGISAIVGWASAHHRNVPTHIDHAMNQACIQETDY